MKKAESRKTTCQEQEKANWTKARRQAAKCGIVLTNRKDSNGDYICYLGKKARINGLFSL